MTISGYTVHLYQHWDLIPFLQRELSSIVIDETNEHAIPSSASCQDVLAAYSNTPAIETSIKSNLNTELPQVATAPPPHLKTSAPTVIDNPINMSKESNTNNKLLKVETVPLPHLNAISPVSAPAVIGNSNDIFSRIDGVTQEVENECLSPANREPSSSIHPDTTQIRLRPAGLTCFFNSTGQLYEVRIETPFSGSVSGIRIGDRTDHMQYAFGYPPNRMTPTKNMPDTILYNLSNSIILRAQLNNANVVETMYVVRKGF